MLTFVLFLRTAIAGLTALLVWLVVSWLMSGYPVPAVTLAATLVSGLVAGMVCASLSPARAIPQAVVSGVVTAVFAVGLLHLNGWLLEGVAFVFTYWPLWWIPTFYVGALCWLAVARLIQGGGQR